jgi:segregation and condensation protein B
MEQTKQLSIIEAVLFSMGDSVELSKIAEVIETDKETAKELIYKLKEKYEEDNSGLSILELNGSFQMCTKPDMYEYLIKIAKAPRKYVLSDTVLETLSIIAYKQPITKIEIERIRGVSCDHAVNRLLDFELIQELGRKDAPGRPILFGTTEQFLRAFGVSSLDELPQLNPEIVEEFKLEAEEEAEINFGTPKDEEDVNTVGL